MRGRRRRRRPQVAQSRCHRGAVPRAPHVDHPGTLSRLERGVVRCLDDRGRRVIREPVHAHHYQLTRLLRLLQGVRALRDRLLEESLLDGTRRTAERVHLLDQIARAALDRIGQTLDVIAPGQRIDTFGTPLSYADDLLGSERERGGRAVGNASASS